MFLSYSSENTQKYTYLVHAVIYNVVIFLWHRVCNRIFFVFNSSCMMCTQHKHLLIPVLYNKLWALAYTILVLLLSTLLLRHTASSEQTLYVHNEFQLVFCWCAPIQAATGYPRMPYVRTIKGLNLHQQYTHAHDTLYYIGRRVLPIVVGSARDVDNN